MHGLAVTCSWLIENVDSSEQGGLNVIMSGQFPGYLESIKMGFMLKHLLEENCIITVRNHRNSGTSFTNI